MSHNAQILNQRLSRWCSIRTLVNQLLATSHGIHLESHTAGVEVEVEGRDFEIWKIVKIKNLVTWCWLMSHNAQILNQRLSRWCSIKTPYKKNQYSWTVW